MSDHSEHIVRRYFAELDRGRGTPVHRTSSVKASPPRRPGRRLASGPARGARQPLPCPCARGQAHGRLARYDDSPQSNA